MKWKAKEKLRSSGPQLVSDSKNPVSVPAFAPIVSDAFEHLKHLPDVVYFPAGKVLITQGAQVPSIYLLRSGLVKLTHVTPDGRETTLGLRSSGSCLGAVWALKNTPIVYSVIALTPCSVSTLSAAEFPAKLIQNSRLMRHFMNTLCNESMSQWASLAQLRVWTGEERLHNFMRERKSVHLTLKTLDPLPMLKQLELAKLLSLTPEHLSRLMNKASAAEPRDCVA
jgi:CRP/FNR family transcriptional regulator